MIVYIKLVITIDLYLVYNELAYCRRYIYRPIYPINTILYTYK